jgi:hypothetical protein
MTIEGHLESRNMQRVHRHALKSELTEGNLRIDHYIEIDGKWHSLEQLMGKGEEKAKTKQSDKTEQTAQTSTGREAKKTSKKKKTTSKSSKSKKTNQSGDKGQSEGSASNESQSTKEDPQSNTSTEETASSAGDQTGDPGKEQSPTGETNPGPNTETPVLSQGQSQAPDSILNQGQAMPTSFGDDGPTFSDDA